MNPVVFQGAQLPRPSVSNAIEALLGDLGALTERQIVLALNALAPATTYAPLPSSQPAPLVDAAQRAALVNLGVRHFAATFSSWMERDFATDVAACLGAVSAVEGVDTAGLAELAIEVLTYSHKTKRHQTGFESLGKAILEHVKHLHKQDPVSADEYELELISKHGWYTPTRRPSWTRPENFLSAAIPNNEQFARRAIGIMVRNDADGPGYSWRASSFARFCDLDWLPKPLACRSALEPSSLDRLQRWSASKEDLINAIRPILGSGEAGRVAAHQVGNLTLMPVFQELAADEQAVLQLFRRPDCLSQPSSNVDSAHWGPPEVIVAMSFPDPLRLKALTALRETGIGDFMLTSADRYQTATRLVHLIAQTAVEGHAKAQNDHLESWLMAEPFRERLKAMDRGVGFITGATLISCWGAMGNVYKDDEQSCRMLSIIIDCGLVNLGNLDKRCHHESIIGPALKRNPQRLAEVIDMGDFLSLAKRFQIPVRIPEGVEIPAALQATMKKAIASARAPVAAAGDVLAHVGEGQPKPRARRKP